MAAGAGRSGRAAAEHHQRMGPQAVAFYASGQLLTEDYYAANKLMKGFIGAANIDTNSRLCMSSAVVGYKRAFGEDWCRAAMRTWKTAIWWYSLARTRPDAFGAVSAAGAGKTQQSADESGRDRSA